MSHTGGGDDASSRGQVSRRDVVTLIAGMGVGAGGTLLGYQVAGPDASPADSTEVSWDEEHDVVVVGYGAAGSTAAYVAADNGADTVVLEKNDQGGEAVRQSYGLLYLGGRTEMQEILGAFDSPEMMQNYMELRYPQADRDRIETFAQNSKAHHDWLRDDVGVPLYTENTSPYRMDYYPGGGLTYSGAEFNQPYAEQVTPMKRGHTVKGEGKGGEELWNALDSAATDAGVTVKFGTPATRLVTNSDGNVEGVIAKASDGEIAIRAHNDVVLATGPFEMNRDMIDKHAPEFMKGKGGYSMVPLHDGAGIRMAQSIGASVENMGQLTADCHLFPKQPNTESPNSRHLLKGMMFNSDGLRFMDESRPPADIGTEILENQDGQAYYLMDGQLISNIGGQPEHLTKLFSANGYIGLIERINRRLDIPYDFVNENIGAYSNNANSGRDPQYGKPRRFLKELYTPPFHVYDLSVETMDLRYETHGGISTRIKGRVLDVENQPIQGLRAAPKCANTITGQFKDGGMNLSAATYFGRLIGKAAAGSSGTSTS
ncbi:MAG: FAD-dependent oxidoreductase [Halobacteriaceae archaeon]